ncbi:hypothetical protein INR79_22050 [Vibrio sp. SCSIO 43132]|uniref:hypothetical protein n=1 Tax=Vibrio sp. SCSIO 43132 TaxID=2779363 RepID=UPI00223BE8EF|nr:hypothetical protein [Vibrio sp. SCSIO 43132]UAB73830.1 hypothetical protein INR79_22050 [Vibrio sp. SCSIO 43132]
MSEIDIKRFKADELTKEKISELVEAKDSFQVVAVRDISFVVNKIEGEIEKQNLSCRVYTEYRSAAMGGMVIPTGVTQVAGIFTAIGVGIHNLATYNPDYEIAKNKFNSTLTVIYQRD